MLRRSCVKAVSLVSEQCSKAGHIRHSTATALHFYQNRQLDLYAAKDAKRLTLRQLVFFGRYMDEDRLIKAANYVRTELAIRIAHRLRDLQGLPYVVVTQEGVAKVYELYWSAFEEFRRFPVITTLAENDLFCTKLNRLLHEHATVIPNLTLGLSLASPHIAPDALDSFMRRMLTSRISRRVLAEHHIALSENFRQRSQQHAASERHVGIIYTGLNVTQSIQKCIGILKERSRQAGNAETPWPEAMWATAVKYRGSPLPPIQATVVAGTDDVGIRISDQGGGLTTSHIKSPSDLFSFSHIRNASRMDDSRLGALRTVSSDPRGVRATVDEQLALWTANQPQTDAQWSEGPDNSIELAIHPRIGIGLPMSNIFATYFGGTDVYLRLPKLGTQLEGIEV
ncbi:hypothetical protein HWV62_40549 [Athelia sp. TMB]|nr:hypothetical protein HWV62_40549 [Athelia sp. TMB]